MSNAYWPEGCNPPETCFTCRHPDCRNSLAGTKKEFDFTRRGFAPDYVPAHGSNEKTERTATLPGKELPLHLLRQAAYSGGWRVQILRGVP